MKNFKCFNPGECKDNYELVEEGIYKINDNSYVTYLSFEYEECDLLDEEEGQPTPQNMTQYPLEDLLDKYYVSVQNFFKDVNKDSEKICYLGFEASNVNDVKNLLSIVGKRAYLEFDGDPLDEDTTCSLTVE